MASELAEAHDDPGMLNRTIRIEELCADNADMRVVEAGHHLFEPIRIEYFDVVIQQQDHFAFRGGHSSIDRPRKIKRLLFDDRLKGDRASPLLLIKSEDVFIFCAIVDDKDFKMGIVRLFFQALNDL